ncbi:FimD/PapC C-terminal domain-containing protein [Morganella psychrotolerans]|nr:FimD/PapC C-terminal domain-containing protein [Morganella psychrotolerans]
MQTRIGSRLLLKLTRQGNALPFGAIASDADSDNSGIVDENGVVYLSGMPDSGKVNVKWGSRPDEQCTADYALTAGQSEQIVKQVTAQCR